jgi:acetyl-CoA carboxylase biotin carboxylase subunit
MKKVLIANRGEIAVRIARTLREMSIASVAVFSEADRQSLHVRMADEAHLLGPAPAAQSYLDIERVIGAAKKANADGLHPGYGFLAENAALAEACEREGIVFIGPSPRAMRAMGSKTAARAAMAEAGVPVVPGGPADTPEQARLTAASIGYPVMIKAAAGGGGKGMRRVDRPEDLASAWQSARSVSKNAFGDDRVYLEKAIDRPRHVEIQVLGDREGNVVHLFERDCSFQRRHQKVIEETPCPVASDELIDAMGAVAVRGARAVGYHSAGTFEFLLAPDGSFYFLEMNTRLQVEHPITEWVTGIDLVREMVNVARGERLGRPQEQIVRRGAAIECRIYAEDPEAGFLPSPGTIVALGTPSGPWVRDDTGVFAGARVPTHYDPLLSKLSVWAPTRAEATSRMQRALREYTVVGIETNLAFHERLLASSAFATGIYDTGFIEREPSAWRRDSRADHVASADPELLAAALAIAAARADRATAPQTGPRGPSEASPWLSAHRARLLGRA